MEPPPGIALTHEVEWVCKEPALVVWNDPDRSVISSLGLPCPTGKPTLLTLWVGQDATKSTHVMLHLRISVRISKRRKTFDHYLLPTSGFSATESCSVVNLEDAPESVRQCVEETYGKSSTKKCLRVPFHQPSHGRVLMPLVPEGAPCLQGTAVHLLTLFRSLSRAENFDIYVGHSSYAQHALMNLETGVPAGGDEVDLTRSYNNGGVFDDWRQVGVTPAIDGATSLNNVATNRKSLQGSNRSVKNDDPAISLEPYGQPTCSPPPYSPPSHATESPVTPQAKAYLKRTRVSTTPEANQSSPKYARRGASFSPTFSNVLHVLGSTGRSFSLESTAYSPTIINTPSTVDDTSGIRPTVFTTRCEPPEYNPTNIDDKIPEPHHQEKVLKTGASSFTSAPELLDARTPSFVMRALNNKLHAQVPQLTEQTLQRITEEALSTLDYQQKVAEIGLQETCDDLKSELQLEKDKGIEDIDEHAQDVLSDVKGQMEDLASGHLVAFEDVLQETGDERLTQTLKVLLAVVAKAVILGREQEQQQQRRNNLSSSLEENIKASASAATKLFLHDFRDLGTADKIKVLERLCQQNTAEVFLTVDKELRGAWIASWIA